MQIKLVMGKSGKTHYAIYDDVSKCWKAPRKQVVEKYLQDTNNEIVDMRR